MEQLYMVLLSFLGLELLVAIHELGHYVAARIVGIPILTFNVGFGPVVAGPFPKGSESTPGRTAFYLRASPLGGFVKADETALDAMSAPRKILFFAGGILANLAACVVFAMAVERTGIQVDTLHDSLGYESSAFFTTEPMVVVADMDPEILPARAGLRIGDEILAVNWEPAPDARAFFHDIDAGADDTVLVLVRREDGSEDYVAWPRFPGSEDGLWLRNATRRSAYLQIVPISLDVIITVSPVPTIAALSRLFSRPNVSGDHSKLQGPIGLVHWMSSRAGREDVSLSLAVVSLSMAMFNVLPIPVLVGGKIAYALLELLARRRIPKTARLVIDGTSVLLLLCLFSYAAVVDVYRWIAGLAP